MFAKTELIWTMYISVVVETMLPLLVLLLVTSILLLAYIWLKILLTYKVFKMSNAWEEKCVALSRFI